MVIDYKYLSVFLFGFNYLSVFTGEIFSFFYFPFLQVFSPSPPPIFHIFPIIFPLFSTTCTRSPGPPIWNGTLLTLYYRYGRYGGESERGKGGFVKSVPFLILTQRKAGEVGVYVCLSALPFFVKLKRNGIFLRHYARAC